MEPTSSGQKLEAYPTEPTSSKPWLRAACAQPARRLSSVLGCRGKMSWGVLLMTIFGAIAWVWFGQFFDAAAVWPANVAPKTTKGAPDVPSLAMQEGLMSKHDVGGDGNAAADAIPVGRQLQDRKGCSNSCREASDGYCDDGGPGSQYNLCDCGTDCNDCGMRSSWCFEAAEQSPSPPPPLLPLLSPPSSPPPEALSCPAGWFVDEGAAAPPPPAASRALRSLTGSESSAQPSIKTSARQLQIDAPSPSPPMPNAPGQQTPCNPTTDPAMPGDRCFVQIRTDRPCTRPEDVGRVCLTIDKAFHFAFIAGLPLAPLQ